MTTLRLRMILLFLVFPLVLSAASAGQKKADSRFSFLRSLYEQKRYFDSIGEAWRLRPCLSAGGRAEIDYFIMGSYYKGEQYFSVINRVSSAEKLPDMRSSLLLAWSYMQVGSTNEAFSLLKTLKTGAGSEPLGRDIFSAQVNALVSMDRYKEAWGEVQAMRQKKIFSGDMKALERKLDQYRHFTGRSPWLSAVMSGFVPGAGQLYSGRYMDAFLSIVSVAAPLTGGVFLLRSGRKQLAGTLFFFSAVFYGGNIYGAWNAAEYHNARARRKMRAEVAGQLPPYDPMAHFAPEKVVPPGGRP